MIYINFNKLNLEFKCWRLVFEWEGSGLESFLNYTTLSRYNKLEKQDQRADQCFKTRTGPAGLIRFPLEPIPMALLSN